MPNGRAPAEEALRRWVCIEHRDFGTAIHRSDLHRSGEHLKIDRAHFVGRIGEAA